MKKLFAVASFVWLAGVSNLLAQSILLPIGSGPYAVELNQDSTLALVVNRNSNTVLIVNLADNSIKNTITVGTFPTSVAINPITNQAVVTNFGSDNISVIDIGSATVVATIAVGKPDASNPTFRFSPRDVAIDTANNIAIVANLNGNSVSLIDLNSNSLIVAEPIKVGSNPISVAYYREKNIALIANYQSDNVSVIDMRNRARIRDIPVGLKPVDIALNLQTKKAVVVNSDTNDITVLDLDKVSVLTANPIDATVSVGSRPFGAVINPNTNFAAVLSSGSKSISLVNLGDNTKFTTVVTGVGDTPTHIALNPSNNTALVASPTNDSIYSVQLGFLNYLPFAFDTEVFRSNLGITNISSAEANLQIELRDKDGNLLASGATKVSAHGLKQLNNVNRVLLGRDGVTNTLGSLRVMSDQPFSSFISVIDNSSNDPGLQVGRSGGFSRLLINSATNTGAFRSRLVLLNLGNTSAAVNLTARDNATGEVLATKGGILIGLNGFYYTDDVFSELGVENNFGPLEIESPNVQPLIGVTLIGSASRTSGFLEAVPIQ
ncbi:MAG: YncE family protein [Acidobacteria bacterium]|nr:YncE family protein [Acidobacteriota bacterium]